MLTPTITTGPVPPAAPQPGDEWFNPVTGRRYIWTLGSDSVGVWLARAPATDPPLPKPGDVWHNPANGRTYVWTLDAGNQGVWLARGERPTVAPQAEGHTPVVTNAPDITNPTPRLTMAEYPPSGAIAGDFWYDTIRGFLFVYYNDGSTIQWVVANPGQGRVEGPPGLTGEIGPPGINWRGEWVVSETYYERDAVEHEGSSYYALVVSAGLPPDTSPDTWALMAEKGDQGEPGGAVTITEGTGIDVTGGPDYTISVQPGVYAPVVHTHPESDIINLVSDLALKAPIASPTFTGDPKAPTPATSDNDTSIATTAFTRAAITAYSPPPDLSGYELKANKGIASGYAPLDATTKVPAVYLPAYVDDVLEFANLAAFPGTGSTGIIYVALDTGKIYRWSGSIYVEISPSPGSTDAVPEGSTNLYFTNERVDDRVDALIVDGANITTTYNDAAGTLTIAAAAYPTSLPGPPTGAAGGDLTGTYPNPTLAVDRVRKTGDTMTGTITGTFGAITTDKPFLDLAQTWNNAATTFNAIKLNVTATAQNDASALMLLQRGGSDVFKVDRFGTLITGGGIYNGDVVQSWGRHVAMANTAIPAGGTQSNGINFSSTANFGIMHGSGLPNKAMARGSWYMRSDATAATGFYVNTDGTAGGWVAGGGGGGASISVGTTAPGSPTDGALWYYTDAVTGGGQLMIYYNDGSTTQWVPASASATTTTTPPGAIMDYAGATSPAGWLLCQGQSVAVATYPNLHAAIGYLYGGSGANFNVPDLGGRVVAGKEATATRLTAAGSGITGSTLGSVGGVETYALAGGHLGSHAHDLGAHNHSSYHGVGYPFIIANGGDALFTTIAGGAVYTYYTTLTSAPYSNGNTGASGSGIAHQNTQPTIIMNKIIKV